MTKAQEMAIKVQMRSKNKYSFELKSLMRNGSITFTTKSKYFEQLLQDCNINGIKVTIYECNSFVSVTLK